LQNAAFTSNASLTSAQMGLSGKLALQPIYTMSGGQKSRVSFAMITWTKPHVMLLDEPTNHLDLVRACTFTDMRRPRTVCNP
jgi:ATPase subunit of ABC transporter with duplicated ATPase domains